MDFESDPAADFLAREQEQLAGLHDEENGVADQQNEFAEATEQDDGGLMDDDPIFDMNGLSATLPAAAQTAVLPGYRPPTPEKISQWREHQKQMLLEKDANEETKKQEMRKQAQKELDDWYNLWNENRDKRKQSNREHEKQYASDSSQTADGSKDWAKVADLCDFQQKAGKESRERDVSRLRSILLQLKQKPPTPSKSKMANGTN